MTHRTVVNCETGVVTQVEYTPEEQAVHDAAVAAQAEAQALADVEAAAQTLAEQEYPSNGQPTNI
jgi:hypothetical protein